MITTKEIGNLFLSHSDNCPFCNAEKYKLKKDHNLLSHMYIETHIYRCNFSVTIMYEDYLNKSNEITNISVETICSPKIAFKNQLIHLENENKNKAKT